MLALQLLCSNASLATTVQQCQPGNPHAKPASACEWRYEGCCAMNAEPDNLETEFAMHSRYACHLLPACSGLPAAVASMTYFCLSV